MVMRLTEDHEFVNRRRQVLGLVKKWKATGLLEGLNKEKAENLSQLLENEAAHLRRTILNESSSVGDIAGFNKIAFPLVRRIFAQLLANEIVSVQPISLPNGLIFYLDFVTDRIKPGIREESIYGTRETVTSPKAQGIGGQLGTGGFYNFSNQIYANRLFTVATVAGLSGGGVLGAASITATSAICTGTLSAVDYTLDAGSSGAVDLLSRGDFRPVLSGEINYDTSSASSFRSMLSVKSLSADQWGGIGASYTGGRAYDIFLTQILSSNRVRIFSNDSTALGSLAVGRVTSGVMMTVLLGRADTTVITGNNPTTNLGDFESTFDIPQINVKILSVQVNAQTKKLKTIWTPELAQDLNAYQSIDAEVELTNILSEQIATEIDREILSDLLTCAIVKAAWSRGIGQYVYVNSAGTITYATDTSIFGSGGQAFYGTQMEWNRTFGEVAYAVSNEIYKRNLRGGANWMVTSMAMATVFESTDIFKAENPTDSTDMKYSLGVERAGTLSNRFTVYKDPYFPVNFVLMGYKGKSALETGYVWSPYVPLIVTPTIFSPDNFNPIKGVMTRNAKTVIRDDYYGTIQVLNLNTWLGM